MKDGGRRKPNMSDVARLAGVSQRTVSNVVNDYQHVTPAMRAKVRAAIADLDYRPNVAAQRLRQGRTGILALAVPSLAWPYFSELAHLIQKAAQRSGRTLLVVETQGNAEFERDVLLGFRTNLIDGLILSPIELNAAELLDMDLGIPVVLLGERIRAAGVLHLSIDNVDGARQVARHLVAQGARSFVVLGSSQSAMTSSAGALRMKGLFQELEANGVTPASCRVIGGSPWTQEDAHRAVLEDFRHSTRPDAIIGMNDLVAFGALRACWELGIDVPGEMLVSGWDDIALGRYATPSITTVSPDKIALAEQAVAGLISALEGAGSEEFDVTVPHHLVVRESTRPGLPAGPPRLLTKDRIDGSQR